MNRIDLIEKATQLAYEEVDGMAACNDTQYKELKKLPEEEAVKTLAYEFLQEAASNMCY